MIRAILGRRPTGALATGALFPACLVLLVGTAAALARGAAFGEFSCRLETGETVALLLGEPILGPLPTAALLLDEEGRLLGYQLLAPGYYPLRDGSCRIADPFREVLLVAAPENDAIGVPLLGDDAGARLMREDIEPGYGLERAFGFRDAGLWEVGPALRLWSEVRYKADTLFFVGALAFTLLFCTALLRARAWRGVSVATTVLGVVLAGGVLAGEAVFIAVGVLFDLPGLAACFAAALIGAAIFALLRAVRTRSPGRPLPKA